MERCWQVIGLNLLSSYRLIFYNFVIMKYYLSLLFVILLAGGLYAQESASKHELFVGYGFAPIASIPEPDLPVDVMVNAPYSTDNKRFSETINVGYLFHVSDPLAIGLSYSHNTVKRDVVLGSSVPLAEIKNTCHTLMVTGKYSWLRLKQFSFYSRIGVGIMSVEKGKMDIFDVSSEYMNLSSATMERDKCIVWQAMPIGVEWNFMQHLALFAEVGAGSAGCGMAGVKILF